MKRVLVLYGTTEGHTATIATEIGKTLTAAGFAIDIIEAGTIDPRPTDYDGIVVAASVHGGKYQKSVAKWLRTHVSELQAKPTAFISVCLAVLQHDPKVTAELGAIVHRFVDPLGWQPTVTKSVAGALLYTKYNFFIRWIMRRIAAKAGGDTDTSRDYIYTDWNDVRAFADDFGRRVTGAATVHETDTAA